jgi:uncharacterized membrane protein YkvA (DUF1232 family)
MPKLKLIRRLFTLRRELRLYKAIVSDPRTPPQAKIILGFAIIYALMPIDIIPDFIPFLGQLDDVVVVPFLFYLSLKLVPKDLLKEIKERNKDLSVSSPRIQQSG